MYEYIVCSVYCVRSMCLPQAQELPGIKIFKFEGALFFANSDRFREQLLQRTGLSTLVESAKKSAAARAAAGTASPSAQRRGSDAAQASGASVAHSQQPSGYGSSSVPGAAGINNSLTRRNRSASQTFEDDTSAFGQVNRPSINDYSKLEDHVSNVRHLVIDLSDCTYVDDAGSKGLNEVCTFTVFIKLLYYPLIKLYTHESFFLTKTRTTVHRVFMIV